jgi:hypothetical protein
VFQAKIKSLSWFHLLSSRGEEVVRPECVGTSCLTFSEDLQAVRPRVMEALREAKEEHSP